MPTKMKSANITINIDNLSKIYRNKSGIREITTCFRPGRINLVIGGNGSGKTTLLKCIMGLVSYKGSIRKSTNRVGYAPETYVMPEFMSVRDFLWVIGRIRKNPKPEFMKGFLYYKDLLGLSECLDRPISKLSNGMRQKVNLFQAIIDEPPIVIMDEPLASLDQAMKKTVACTLKKLSKDHLVIISTHNPECFRQRKKQVYEIEKGRLLDNGAHQTALALSHQS